MSRLLIVALLLCCSPLRAWADGSNSITIGFAAPVARQADIARLEDIAYLRSTDLDLRAQIGSIQVSLPEDAKELTQDFVIDLIRQNVDMKLAINWIGPAVLPIATAGLHFDQDELVSAAAEALETALGRCSDEVRIKPVGRISGVTLPNSDAVLSVDPLTVNAPRARMPVRVKFLDGSSVIASRNIWFEVSAFANAFVAVDDLVVGTPVNSQTFRLERIDLASQGKPAMSVLPTERMQLRKPLREGEALAPDSMQITPAIIRGEDITVSLTSGPIHLRSRGTAHSDGNPGESILVTVDGAESPIQGRITEGGEIEISY